MPRTNRLHFKMMSFFHETLYGLFRDPFKVLVNAGLEPSQRVLEVGVVTDLKLTSLTDKKRTTLKYIFLI